MQICVHDELLVFVADLALEIDAIVAVGQDGLADRDLCSIRRQDNALQTEPTRETARNCYLRSLQSPLRMHSCRLLEIHVDQNIALQNVQRQWRLNKYTYEGLARQSSFERCFQTAPGKLAAESRVGWTVPQCDSVELHAARRLVDVDRQIGGAGDIDLTIEGNFATLFPCDICIPESHWRPHLECARCARGPVDPGQRVGSELAVNSRPERRDAASIVLRYTGYFQLRIHRVHGNTSGFYPALRNADTAAVDPCLVVKTPSTDLHVARRRNDVKMH